MIITYEESRNLINKMQKLLYEYDYDYTLDALNTIINEWESQKSIFIEAFKRHPNYVEGEFLIALDASYERVLDVDAVRNFGRYICHLASLYWNDIPEDAKTIRGKEGCAWLPMSIWDFFNRLEIYAQKTVSEETAAYLNDVGLEGFKAHAGQKTSRMVNKLCEYLGYTKHDEYNRQYAKFADSLSPITIKRKTILSINPLDYLTMSFGNSWASCHTIDKENKRNMPNSYEGMYSSGTVSYMLDPSSMVLYTVDDGYQGTEYYFEPKINRQMFHWGEDKLVQGRLYPQDNDGCGSVYQPYRNIVQEIMSKIFDFPNLWTISKGNEAASRYIVSKGTHYRDYVHYENCSLSRIKFNTNENSFIVGAEPICISCGERHSTSENINCCWNDCNYCEDCGCRIRGDDTIWINYRAYCRDCVESCDICGEYIRREDSYWIESENRSVCEHCINEYYTCCEHCNSYIDNNDLRWSEELDEWICDDCFDDLYECCAHCGCIELKDNMCNTDDGYVCQDCYDALTEEDEYEEEAC